MSWGRWHGLGLAVVVAHPHAAPLYSWDFSRGDSGLSFFARAPDSANAALSTGDCHSGTSCYAVQQRGSQDWALSPSGIAPTVATGEIWTWSAWAKADSVLGGGGLSFVAYDSVGKPISWNLVSTAFAHTQAWTRTEVVLVVPEGCRKILPRIGGWGPGQVVFDDLELVKTRGKPAGAAWQRLANDSLELWLDPLSLAMRLRDSITGDTVVIEPLTTLAFDSVQLFRSSPSLTNPDSLLLACQYLPGGWPLQVGMRLHGGALQITLHADSARVMVQEMQIPGRIRTRVGQRLAMPRGTGIVTRVDDIRAPFMYTTAQFWDWQVSMGMTGATDGQTGFVVDFLQPWDAKIEWKGGMEPLLFPNLFQSPAKLVWGHDRSLQVAPLRHGGWKEMADRHRANLDKRRHLRTWSEKIRANPSVERMRGAADFWFIGNWAGTNYRFFDTLRSYGIQAAMLHSWGMGTRAETDSLVARGWLPSYGDNWADAYASDPGANGREYSAGAVMRRDGSLVNGWLGRKSDGTPDQALEICAARHEHLARANFAANATNPSRRARFIDVELSVALMECWSPTHPTTRGQDLEARLGALRVIKDEFGQVTGSEQTRDEAHDVVDFGEGPMSIASTSDAGRDWSGQVSPTSLVDGFNFDPSRRVPLLGLADHDVFTPTWYTGDGQSKIPARWDAKDAWTALYGSMAVIVPGGRAMWEAQRPRYLRSMLLLGATHDRFGFEPMTDFAPLTPDWRLQQTRFGNGWSVIANLDTVDRQWESDSFPGSGFLARKGDERIGRIVWGGAPQSLVRLRDRWMFDPEGRVGRLDGIRASEGVSLQRIDDTTVELALWGTGSIDLRPADFAWKTDSVRVVPRGQRTPVVLTPLADGWQRLERDPANAFYTLHGNFGRLSDLRTYPAELGSNLHLERKPGGMRVTWTQSQPGPFGVEVLRLDGKRLQSVRAQAQAGPQAVALLPVSGVVLVVARTPDGQATWTLSSLR